MAGDTDALRAKWDARYRAGDQDRPRAAVVLRAFAHLLPATGEALDLACGRGGNALLLAEHGLRTRAWDLSPVAIESLQTQPVQGELMAEVRDVSAGPPEPQSCDVVVVSYFLDRTLFPALVDALRPGGLVFYQTFIRDKVADTGPSNPDFLLAPNELLQVFGALRCRLYREEGGVGDTAEGFRNEAMYIGQKL